MDWAPGFDWLRVLVEYLIKSTFALSCAVVLASFFRRRSASLRHFVLSFFLIGLLLLPALSTVRFGWETGLLPSRTPLSRLSAQDGRTDYRANGIDTIRETAFDSDAAGRAAAPASLVRSNPGSTDGRRVGTPVQGSFGLLAGIAGILVPFLWLAGLFILLSRLAAGLRGACRMTREGETIDDPVWKVLLERFLARIRLKRRVRLKSHDDVVVPLTWGFVKPVILVPSDYKGWSEGQRSSALVHELSHIKRGDFLVMMLVRLSLALFWFNPLSWIVYGMMKREQEKACDELVLKAGIKPSTYAANLLMFRRAAGFRWDPSTAILGMTGRSPLSERLASILRQKLTFKEVRMKTKIMIGIAVLMAVALIGVARPSAAPSERVDATALSGPIAFNLAGDSATAVRSIPEVEEAAPETSQVEAAPQEREKQEQEKAEQEQEKKKKEEKKTIVITTKEGKEIPIEIIIYEGGETKTLKIEKSLTLKKGEEGELILLSPEGKELTVLKGDPIRLSIKGGDLQVIKEGDFIKIDKEKILGLVSGKDLKESGIHVMVSPETKIHKIGEGDEKKIDIYLHSVKEGESDFTWVAKADVKPGIKIITKEGEKPVVAVESKVDVKPYITVVTKEGEKPAIAYVTKADVKPHVTLVGEAGEKSHIAWVSEGDVKWDAESGVAWTLQDKDEELQKKIEEIREKLKALKGEEKAIGDIEKALEELEAQLKAHEKAFRTVEVQAGEKPNAYYVLRKTGEDDKKVAGLFIGEDAKKTAVTVRTGKKGMFSMAYAIQPGENSREIYERTVERVKKELPEGYAVEPEFNEKKGMITFTITGPTENEGAPVDFVKKLVDIIKEEIK